MQVPPAAGSQAAGFPFFKALQFISVAVLPEEIDRLGAKGSGHTT
jgi:hypothetical protein